VAAKNQDLHGNAPDNSSVALVLIDVINDLEWDGSDDMLPRVKPMALRIADLKRRAKATGIPVIYANDNFGKWQSDFNRVVQHCLEDGVKGEELVQILEPDDDDYFVLKPKHSAFFASPLDVLLEYLGVRTLILAGIAGNICVLFTASDAYIRDYDLFIPADCSISNTEEENENALAEMGRVLKADLTPSTELDLEAIKRGDVEDVPDSRRRARAVDLG
jgi:nicotinamidase-related amidase